MKRYRIWIGAGLLLTLAAALILSPSTGRRALRALDVRYGLTEQGRRAQFDALVYQAKQEFIRHAPEDQSDLRPVEYPAKPMLLARQAELLQYLREEERWRDFRADLLRSIDPEVARPILREWLNEPDTCYFYGRSAEVVAILSVDERKQIALDARPECRWSTFQAVPLNARDERFLQTIILRQQTETGIPWHLIGDPAGQAAALKLYDQLNRAARVSLVWQLSVSNAPVPGGSMEGWLSQESDPAVRQELLYRLKAYEGLMNAVERDGIFFENSFWSDWRFMQQMVATRPDSYLARGIAAYEAVRGKPYFHIDRDRRTGEYGNTSYDPDREIPGWEAWLQEFPAHEGADDAAYRLGRSYEIAGHYDLALKWLEAATRLGDGEMGYAARGRIVWVLDALLSQEQLSGMPIDALPDGLKVARAYSIALRDLRAGRYADAADQLNALLAGYSSGPEPLPRDNWEFWAAVREQQAKAVRLAALMADYTPEGRYALAAAIYHDEYMFYNYLWGGGRQWAIQYGYHLWALQGDMDSAYSRWVAESNNYIQAAEAFDQLVRSDPPVAVAEKALYSRGLALMRAARHYGPEVVLWQSTAAIEAEAESALKAVVSRFPRGELAPDALLSLGYLTNDAAYFEQVQKGYPRSTAAAEARTAEPMPYGTFQWVPFRYVGLEAAPPQVAEWARRQLGQPGKVSMNVGGATWLLVTTDREGQEASVAAFSQSEARGVLQVNAAWAPRPGALGYVLLRFEGLWKVAP